MMDTVSEQVAALIAKAKDEMRMGYEQLALSKQFAATAKTYQENVDRYIDEAEKLLKDNNIK